MKNASVVLPSGEVPVYSAINDEEWLKNDFIKVCASHRVFLLLYQFLVKKYAIRAYVIREIKHEGRKTSFLVD